ncbi:MAG: hypothetical protein HYT08_03955 [Candidatus Levybacteria bacterium]|nr:hypothetical protein [Candidatus Levybacteria bacterium]
MRNLVLILASLLGLIGFFMIAEAQAAPYQPVLGDANCDSSVSAVDASLALRFSAGLVDYSDCLSLADVDCDVDIDTVDALSILRFVAGMPGKALCAPGNTVPADDPEAVISTQALVDPNGKTIGSLVGIAGEGSGPTAAASYYRSCWSEIAAKNIFGQKVAWLKHNQSFLYDGSRVMTMFTPFRTAGSMLGWDVDNLSTSGPYNYGTWGQSWSSARFKFSVPIIGTVQSYWVNAGVNAYGWGGCWAWT